MSASPTPPQDSVNGWLAAFAQAEGLADLQLDERGLIGLQVDAALEIEIEVPLEQDLVYLRSTLMPIPAQDRESVYAWLLKRNFLLQDSGGAAFAIDADRAQLALSLCQPIGRLDALDFANLLRGFINISLRCQAQLIHEFQAAGPQYGGDLLPYSR